MKWITALILSLMLAYPTQAEAGIIIHEDQVGFQAAHPTAAQETYTLNTGPLVFVGTNTGFPPLLLGGRMRIQTDGNLFQATGIFHDTAPFQGFGTHFEGVGAGIFALFIDAELEWVRPDGRSDFFLGATGTFDLFVIQANVGPYWIDDSFYVIPEPSSILLVLCGLYCLLGRRVRIRPIRRNRGHI
jgi:hypothetical protein